MNPVLLLTHNCLELTKKCVESVRNQDIETEIMLIDNASTDGTKEWFDSPDSDLDGFIWTENRGVSAGWNYGIHTLLAEGAESILCINNDTVLPSFFYSKLLSYNLPFVTGISVDNDPLSHPQSWPSPAECPDFSAFLIRRDCWEAVGKFDESMKHYASDCDYHVRAHKLGMKLLNAGVPFHHERSSTLKQANHFDRQVIGTQAARDRETFRAKWGCIPGEPAYSDLFEQETLHAE